MSMQSFRYILLVDKKDKKLTFWGWKGGRGWRRVGRVNFTPRPIRLLNQGT